MFSKQHKANVILLMFLLENIKIPCTVLSATLTLSQPGGGRLCPPYTGVLSWLKFAVAALIYSDAGR